MAKGKAEQQRANGGGGRADATRARLLEAATRAFAARGFARAGVREICAAARCNLAAVNYHFGDKAGLYRAVLLGGFQEAGPFPPPVDRRLPAHEQLHALLEGFLRRLLASGRTPHARIMARELVEPTPALREVVETAFRPLHDRIRGLLRTLRPDLPGGDLDLHTISVIGQCVVYRHARPALDLIHGPDALGEAEVPRIARHVARQVLGGLGRHDLVPAEPASHDLTQRRSPTARRRAARAPRRR